MIGGEVKGDAGAERDRHPGQQAAGTGFRARPLAQGFDERRPDSGTRWYEAPGRRRRTRRPGSGIAPFSARNVALLRHAGYTLRSRGERKTTGRCIAAASGTDAETGRNAHRPALHWGIQESDEGRTSHEACGLHFDCAGDIGFAVCNGGARAMPFHRGAVRARGVLSAPGNGTGRPAEGPGNPADRPTDTI